MTSMSWKGRFLTGLPFSPSPGDKQDMTLTNSDILDLVALRHDLHRHPEVSGSEARTAQRIVQEFAPLSPDDLITDLGGEGVAAVFDGCEDGPTVLFRCELDALPIYETGRRV